MSRRILVPLAAVALLLCGPSRTAFAEDESRDDRLASLANRAVDLDEGEELDGLRAKVREVAAGDVRALARALRKGPSRRPAKPGTSTFRLRVPLDGVEPKDATTECSVDVPPGYDPARSWPLVVGIHFTGGSGPQAASFLRRITRESGCLLACPTGTVGRTRGWMFTEAERSLHRETIRQMIRRYHVDPARIVLVGWSRGGHASWDLGVRHPDLVAGILPVVGGLTDRDVGLLPNLKGRPIRAFQGARDQPALVTLHRRAVEAAKRAGCDVVYVEDPARGHDLFLDRTEAALAEILARPRPGNPREVTLATQGAPASVAWWVRVDELSPKAYVPGKPLRIAGARKLEGDALRNRMLKEYRDRTARVDATIERDGRIVVRTRHVRRLTLLLPLEHIAPGSPVRVKLNGRERTHEPIPDTGLLLETVRRRGSRELLPWGSVELTAR